MKNWNNYPLCYGILMSRKYTQREYLVPGEEFMDKKIPHYPYNKGSSLRIFIVENFTLMSIHI